MEMDSLLMQTADSLAADSLAMTIPADSIDSLAMPADSVYRLLKGFRDVRIYRSDFQAVCDSITAISTDSTIHMYIDPVLWNQSNQITSDVDGHFHREPADHARRVRRQSHDGLRTGYAPLQPGGGQADDGLFPRQCHLPQRCQRQCPDDLLHAGRRTAPDHGVGVIESGDCSFYIEDKQVITIVYRKDPDWNIYPMDKIPPDQELFLKGFKWEGARRPTQADVFDRRIRPSQREAKSLLPHPDFPLLKNLEERKKKLIEERRWADRNELVDAATVEWMRVLGFEVGQPRESGPKL